MSKIKPKYKILVIVCIGIFAVFALLGKNSKQSIQIQNLGTENKGGIISGEFDRSKFKTDAEWEKILTPKQYYILREAGTEAPFTGKLDQEKRKGTYYSVGCNTPVFRSEQKYDSGTGWPSFWDPISLEALVLRSDNLLGVERIEVLDKCGGHLGHVFDDGPRALPDGRQATGKRYCMNSEALYFKPDEK